MEIHVLYILKKTGECIYSRIFTSQFENAKIDLITPFFSAFFTFSNIVLSEEIDTLEMGKYKFIFKQQNQPGGVQPYIFCLQSDITFSNLYLKSCLDQISEKFFLELKDYLWMSDEVVEDSRFDSIIDEIIFGGGDLIRKIDLYSKVEDVFKEFHNKQGILGAALLTNSGEIIYTSLPNQILISSLKELEIRFISGASFIPELFYSLEDGKKVFSKEVGNDEKEHYMVFILFEDLVPLGLAELTLNKVAKALKEIF
ncbi:MAG: hypothetical protein ACTSR8_06310 [Promethearchaeota archaeon]